MSTELDEVEISGIFGNDTKIVIKVVSIVVVLASIILSFVLFRMLGIVSSASVVFGLMVSIIISALVDLQITFAGWIGFILGFVLNFVFHMYYLKVIKNEFASGKKFTISFTSGYKKALFNILDLLLIITASTALLIIIPSNYVRLFAYNFIMTIPGTAYTAMYLNKVLAVNYTAFNSKDYKKLNFTREEEVDEIN